jgi:uncharacterized protein
VSPERPRDRLGRPLPWDVDPAQVAEAVPSVSGLADDAVWALALRYLDRGLPFHAHEIFEARWRDAPQADRDAWQALAQWAAAITHEARGNGVGAQRLARRAAELLASAPSIPGCIDVERVLASCRALSGAPDGS